MFKQNVPFIININFGWDIMFKLLSTELSIDNQFYDFKMVVVLKS